MDCLAMVLNRDKLELTGERIQQSLITEIFMGIVRVELLHGFCAGGIHFVPGDEPYMRTSRVVRTHFRLTPGESFKYSQAQVCICVTVEPNTYRSIATTTD